MLSPSSFFAKIIGVLANNGGGKFGNHHWLSVAASHSWTSTLLLLVGLGSRHFHLAFRGFGLPFCLIPSDPCCLHQASNPLVPKCCHIPESCRRYVQEYNLFAVHTLTSSSNALFHHLPLVPCLASLMGERLWPSCDGSPPVDTSSLSRRFI